MRRVWMVVLACSCGGPGGAGTTGSSSSSTSATATASAVVLSASPAASLTPKQRFAAMKAAHGEVQVAKLDELVKLYDENAVRGDATYKGKPFSIVGEVERVTKLDDRPVLVFAHKVEGDRYGTLTKSLWMGLNADDAQSMSLVTQLSPGDIAAVLCEEFTGWNDDSFTAKHCAVIERVADPDASASAKH
jgi:hypothetical protein